MASQPAMMHAEGLWEEAQEGHVGGTATEDNQAKCPGVRRSDKTPLEVLSGLACSVILLFIPSNPSLKSYHIFSESIPEEYLVCRRLEFIIWE